jgi:Flp pilus assembly protein TadD
MGGDEERFDRACELWGEARLLSPDSVSLLYNLGVCAELTGNLEQAADLYHKAHKLTTKPDDRITEALKRISDSIRKQSKLRDQS